MAFREQLYIFSVMHRFKRAQPILSSGKSWKTRSALGEKKITVRGWLQYLKNHQALLSWNALGNSVTGREDRMG